MEYDDCPGDCKETKYLLYIIPDKNIWSIEKLSLILHSIEVLGYTPFQCKLVAENILVSNTKYKIFSGEKDITFKVLDKLLPHGLECKIVKVEAGLIK